MKIFRTIALTLALCLSFALMAPGALALEAPQLTGKAALVVDLDSGSVLYEKNSQQRRHPASLTKVMTTLLTLEAVDKGAISLDDVVTAQPDCLTGLAEDSSHAGIAPGTQLTVRDLIYAMMLASANEACNVIASHLGGSISGFVDMMNQKAQELGCLDTHFINPNGLPGDDHYTTAYDLYLITREAMRYPMFMEVANTLSYTASNPAVNDGRAMINSNALINPQCHYSQKKDYTYEGASGVKTGYTNAAGYCLISTAQRDGINVLAIAMGCLGELNGDMENFRNFDDTIAMYDWVFGNFSHREVIDMNAVLGTVAVELGKEDAVSVKPGGQIDLLLPNDLDLGQLQKNVELYSDSVKAPVAAGTVLGRLSLSMNGQEMGSVDLVSADSVELSRIAYIMQKLGDFFSQGWVVAVAVIVLVFLLLYLVLMMRYRRLRQRHLRERRRMEQRRRAERERMYAQERSRRYREEDSSYDRGRDLSRYFDDDDSRM